MDSTPQVMPTPAGPQPRPQQPERQPLTDRPYVTGRRLTKKKLNKKKGKARDPTEPTIAVEAPRDWEQRGAPVELGGVHAPEDGQIVAGPPDIIRLTTTPDEELDEEDKKMKSILEQLRNHPSISDVMSGKVHVSEDDPNFDKLSMSGFRMDISLARQLCAKSGVVMTQEQMDRFDDMANAMRHHFNAMMEEVTAEQQREIGEDVNIVDMNIRARSIWMSLELRRRSPDKLDKDEVKLIAQFYGDRWREKLDHKLNPPRSDEF